MFNSRVPESRATVTTTKPRADSVAFLGAGTMGTALLRGSLLGGLDRHSVWVAARRAERAGELAKELGVYATTSNAEAAGNCAIVVLAVPPDAVPEIVVEIQDSLAPSTILISIADQISLTELHEHLPVYTAAARVMPSLLCEIGSGISLVTFDERCTPAQRQAASELLGRSGQVIETSEEEQPVLAVLSSGGPGYFAYAAEAMIDTLTEQGVSGKAAREVAVAVMGGTARWLAESDRTPSDLQRKVCTPGGAGSKRIAELDRLGVAAGIIAALMKNVDE